MKRFKGMLVGVALGAGFPLPAAEQPPAPLPWYWSLAVTPVQLEAPRAFHADPRLAAGQGLDLGEIRPWDEGVANPRPPGAPANLQGLPRVGQRLSPTSQLLWGILDMGVRAVLQTVVNRH